MGRLYITEATNEGNLSVTLRFSDNTSQTVDIGAFIRRHPHPQYNKYLDEKKFSQFKLENGNIVWGKNWDLIFPVEQLHSGSLINDRIATYPISEIAIPCVAENDQEPL